MEKRQRNTIIIGTLIVGLMVTSVFGLIGQRDTTGSREYNGHEFFIGSQGWFTRVQNRQVVVTYLPDEVDNITLPTKINLEVDKIYIVDDSRKGVFFPLDRIRAILVELSRVRAQGACLSGQGCDETLPLVDCQNSPAQIMHFKIGEKTENYLNGSCLVFEVNVEEEGVAQEYIYRLTERVAYDMLGII